MLVDMSSRRIFLLGTGSMGMLKKQGTYTSCKKENLIFFHVE